MHTSRILTTVVAAAAVVALAAPAVSASPTADPTASDPRTAPTTTDAGYGAGWLAGQLSAHDGHLVAYGATDLTDTAYAVLGLHATGVGRAAGAKAVRYMQRNLGGPLRDADGTDDPGRLGYVIMAAVASGANAHQFGGTAPVNDLPARLLATARTSGPDAGLFGTGDPTYDGAFRQGVALAALAAAGIPIRTVKPEIGWLAGQQCADGLWTSYRSDTSVACPAADPDTFAGPDTNSTGSAAQGLAAYRTFPRHDRLVRSLRAVRSADGGFPYLAAPGQSSDPDSTALSIQALLAEGADPGTAYAALDAYQLGCSDPAADRGAYYFPGSRDPSVFATVQSVPAAAGVTLPLRASSLSAAVPGTPCAAAATAARHPTRAGTAGACAPAGGVTATVDDRAFGKAETTRCAAGSPSSGITAMQAAGYTPTGTSQYGLAFVCRIDGLPTSAQQTCQQTPPAAASWSLWTAGPSDTGWHYATTGASSYTPPVGSIEAWAFGDRAQPQLTPAQVRAAVG